MTAVGFPQASPFGGGASGGKRTGVCRPDGRCVRDEQGLFNPLGTTLMWSMQGIQWDPDNHWENNVDWCASKRIDFIRPLTEVKWDGHRLLDPQKQAWWPDVLRRMLDVSYSKGVRLGVTLRGKGTDVDHMWLAREVARAINEGRTHNVLACEMENEYSNGGDPLEELMDMATAMAGILPNMLGLSTPGNEAEASRIKQVSLQLALEIMILHTERGNGDHGWRAVRQSYDFNNFRPLVGADWEGPGPGGSGEELTNPLQLAMKRIIAVMCGSPIFILHTGTGVYGDGRTGPQGQSRPPNLWEIANIDNIVAALRGVDSLLPEGVSNWTVANTQWQPPNPVAPFQPHHHWEGDAANDDKGQRNNGVNKAYSALAPDGRVMQAPCGVREHVIMTASYPLRDVAFTKLTMNGNAMMAELFADGRSFNTGDTITLPGGGQDAMVAYTIHGRRS